MKSVLHKASRADISDDPFPHIVVKDALDEELYEALATSFPDAQTIIDGRELSDNRYYHYHAREALTDPRISPLWRRFIDYHVSRDFFAEVASLFGDHIRSLHSDLEARIDSRLEDLDTSIRFKEEFRDVALECQFAYWPPASEPTRPIGAHVDREVALYAGLLYFRLHEDDSAGGDLELYRFNSDRRRYGERRRVPDECVERVKVIEYQRNTLVFFLHSPGSVHGVSPRSATRFPRLHMNFVGELQTKVFDLC